MFARYLAKQTALIRNARLYHGSGHKSTMNDLPVPKGDWQEQFSRQNSRYNLMLVLGVAVFGGTVAYTNSSGVVNFNYSHPTSLE